MSCYLVRIGGDDKSRSALGVISFGGHRSWHDPELEVSSYTSSGMLTWRLCWQDPKLQVSSKATKFGSLAAWSAELQPTLFDESRPLLFCMGSHTELRFLVTAEKSCEALDMYRTDLVSAH